jgi:hypothetical protein
MFGLFKKYSVSVLNQSWVQLYPIVKVKFIPRSGELIYFEEGGDYYKILNVIHYLKRKQGIFLIVEKIDKSSEIADF